MAKTLISIVVPVFNEELNLRGLHAEVTGVMKNLGDYEWEFMFVDDGSRDGSFRLLEELRTQDPCVRAVRFPRNFGSHVAIAAGIDHCHGDSAIIMAADLQDPPSLIPEFIAKWRQGFDVVWGARTGRDDGKVRAWAMARFYSLVRRTAIPTYPKGGTGSFCMISRPVIAAFRTLTEHNRLTFGLIAWAGFRETQVPYHRPRRLAGSSSWTTRQMVKAAIDMFISFSSLPIRAISYLGLLVSAFSFVFGFYVLIGKAVYGAGVPGWASVTLAVTFLGGVQLVMIGVLGEYLGRILDETRGRPLYIVERTIGL